MMKRLFCLLSLLLLPSPLLAQSWALPGWQYRIAVTVPGATQANHMVRVDVDFSSQLAALAATGSFDGLSPRVVRADGVIVPVQEFSDRIYANATDAAANGRGEIRFLATAAAPQSYYIYFDTIQNGPKPANPQLPINGNFEAGSSGQASPAGWAAPVKSNTAFDAQVRPSETVPITASPAAVDGVQTRNTDGTPSTGAFSYLIGNRSTTGGGIAGNLAVLFTRDIAVPAANPGNLQFRYRPEGWDTTGFDAIRIDLLDASGAVLTELVGPTAGNYAQRPWGPNTGNAVATATSAGYRQYNGFDCTLSGTHTLAMTVPCNSEPWFAVTQSLAAYAGQMVRLRVRFSSDAQDKSWFHLDDVEWSVLSATLGMAEKISAGIVVTKTSNVMSDPANGSINPKAIPGAVVRYCVLIANNGPAAADLLSATDALPLQTGFVPGTLRTAANCTTIGASEDDDALGADEADPVGAGFAAGTITANLGTLSNGATIALLYDVVVQ